MADGGPPCSSGGGGFNDDDDDYYGGRGAVSEVGALYLLSDAIDLHRQRWTRPSRASSADPTPDPDPKASTRPRAFARESFRDAATATAVVVGDGGCRHPLPVAGQFEDAEEEGPAAAAPPAAALPVAALLPAAPPHPVSASTSTSSDGDADAFGSTAGHPANSAPGPAARTTGGGGREGPAMAAVVLAAAAGGGSARTTKVAAASAAGAAPRKKKDRRRNDERWGEMLSRLRSFRSLHGHTVIPRGYAPDPPLASWVAEQRKQYRIFREGRAKKSNITEERIALLDGLGFEWGHAQRGRWQGHFEDLRKFKERFGHTSVPLGHEGFPKLGLWVKEQRRHYALLKRGEQSHITSERISMLDSIGFVWDSHEATWWERYQELQKYRAEVGHCCVPSKHPPNPKLGTWVHHQRRQYRLLKRGQTSHLTPERAALLNEIGFQWQARATEIRGSKVGIT